MSIKITKGQLFTWIESRCPHEHCTWTSGSRIVTHLVDSEAEVTAELRAHLAAEHGVPDLDVMPEPGLPTIDLLERPRRCGHRWCWRWATYDHRCRKHQGDLRLSTLTITMRNDYDRVHELGSGESHRPRNCPTFRGRRATGRTEP